MKFLDQTFEAIVTGMEMIDAIVEAHKELCGDSDDEPKDERVSTFRDSLDENKEGNK